MGRHLRADRLPGRRADDFAPVEVAAAADAIDADWRTDPGAIDDGFLGSLAESLLATRSVAIDPERASMRVMGTRFVLTPTFSRLRGEVGSLSLAVMPG